MIGFRERSTKVGVFVVDVAKCSPSSSDFLGGYIH
jgi:hypothetical protein